MIVGSIADILLYTTEQCYSRVTGTQDKELTFISDATHSKIYYVPEYVGTAVRGGMEFFDKEL